jgi:ribosomal protein L34E
MPSVCDNLHLKLAPHKKIPKLAKCAACGDQISDSEIWKCVEKLCESYGKVYCANYVNDSI